MFERPVQIICLDTLSYFPKIITITFMCQIKVVGLQKIHFQVTDFEKK